ncbi:putative aldouronate transport system substrate-binding protein [Paenibacillus castaneae]|uniref:extracellular solute-binding protein n=1 Tax=Paenibacillus castaneae TaxID=474957 RepID=UPI000C9C175A|nr:extracellular solute-binding protein [Paenibacillus castaneae]NIK78323.1 putative aldouronate transport system substrate-binding protein [Paenibacillus castaneae]
MKGKKVFKTVMAGVISLALLAGCSAKNNSVVQNAGNTNAGKGSDDSEMIGNMYVKGLPIVKDKVTLKMIGIQGPTTANFADMPFFKELEEKTNVHIEWELYQQSSYPDKKNILLASDEVPDAFFGPEAFSIEDANKFGPQGTVIPLNDLIEKYAPNYKEAMNKQPLLSGMSTASDGKKYTMGTVIEQVQRNYPGILYINKQWLSNLGLEVPTTLDEYYNVLKAFKEQDPNGDGNKNDEIPYTFLNFNHITGYGQFFGAFGRVDVHNSGGNAVDHFVIGDDGKLVFTADKPEYKEAISYLSKFFKEGLFDQEGFTQDPKQFDAKMKDPKGIVGSFYAWSSQAVSPETADQYVAINPFKGPSGEEPVVMKRNNNINVRGNGFAITHKNKNPEITMRWVDEFYNQLTSIESQYGPVGIGLIDKGDGTFDFNTKDVPEGITFMELWHQNAPFDQSPKFITADMLGTVVPITAADEEKADNINKFYLNAKQNNTLPVMNFTPDEIKTNTTEGLDIGNYVKDTQTKWLLNGGIDAEWDAYVNKLKQLKLDQFVASMQGAYDRVASK